MSDLHITVLVENIAGRHGLLGEHGLSFWIERGRTRLLFDTGQGMVLRHNAQRLGVPLDSSDGIVLSHGHYDHTGGLPDALGLSEGKRLFLAPDALEPKYAQNSNGSSRYIGMAESIRELVYSKAHLLKIEQPTEITEGILCTGPIPRTNDFEDTGGAFFKDKDCAEIDPIHDDQAAFVDTRSGIVVILGCAHAGIVNTLRSIQQITDNRPIRAILGGMHLLHASPERMEATIAELHRLNVERLIPCHCTGFTAMARLWNEFPKKYEAITVGSILSFDN